MNDEFNELSNIFLITNWAKIFHGTFFILIFGMKNSKLSLNKNSFYSDFRIKWLFSIDAIGAEKREYFIQFVKRSKISVENAKKVYTGICELIFLNHPADKFIIFFNY